MSNKVLPKYNELKLAGTIAWSVVSVITLLTALAPFVLSKQAILQNAPTCISKSRYNVECALCGMTRAFIEITRGNFNNAYHLNRGSIFLYPIFLLNGLVFSIFLISYIRLKSKQGITRHNAEVTATTKTNLLFN